MTCCSWKSKSRGELWIPETFEYPVYWSSYFKWFGKVVSEPEEIVYDEDGPEILFGVGSGNYKVDVHMGEGLAWDSSLMSFIMCSSDESKKYKYTIQFKWSV